jgi:hypothetical protein
MVCAVLPLGARDVSVTILDGELGIPLEGAEIRSYDGTDYLGDSEGRVVLTVPDDQPVLIRGSYPGYSSERLTIDLEHDEFVLELSLTGILEARELVLEESREREVEEPEVHVMVPEKEEVEIQPTEEPEIVEVEMPPIAPSPELDYPEPPIIRGGQSGDLMAVMDGFYIENPYHWDGGFSIFDPRMVQSARPSHGVFSARYGHTMSGILDLSVKKPAPQALEFDLGLSSSVADASLSFPLNSRGGVMITGRLTYYDPVVLAAQGISLGLGLEGRPVQAISTTPYIRNAALRSSYRFTDKLELGLTGFFGADGVAVDAERRTNYQGFGFADLSYTLRDDMVLKAGLGAGFLRLERNGDMVGLDLDDRTTVQARLDFDWDLGRGFLVSLGLEESYARLKAEIAPPQNYRNGEIHSLASSVYLLGEYGDPERFLGAELGLRLDHVFFTGDAFFANSLPVLSPRLNFDFNLLKNRGPFDSLTLSLGVGLFSSTTELPDTLWKPASSGDSLVKPSRALTGMGGLGIEFSGGIGLDVEAYYKYVFDRTYVFSDLTGRKVLDDGQGHVWGLDLTLQKAEGRYIDTWIAYSFNQTRYREPGLPEGSSPIINAVSGDWYSPPLHRSHELNLVLNIKPTEAFTIATRLGVTGPEPVSIPLDIRFSFFYHKPPGKVREEFYVAVENLLALFYTVDGAPYNIPIPIPSFGFRWSY